jgi:excisionase family DNA binding protein
MKIIFSQEEKAALLQNLARLVGNNKVVINERNARYLMSLFEPAREEPICDSREDRKPELDVPVMMKVSEVQKTYGLSKQHIYDLAKSGKVKSIMRGNRYIINAQSVSDYLNTCPVDKETAPAARGIRPLG